MIERHPMTERHPHRSRVMLSAAILALARLACPVAQAAEIELLKSPLVAVDAQTPILKLGSGPGTLSLSLAAIERFPMKESTLRTGFGMEGTFQGVLLDDLLAAAKLTTAASVTVVAADDYAITIERRDIEAVPAMLATRFNGKPITDPNRGPLILIWPKLEQDVLAGRSDGANWVWSVQKIRGSP